jgi:hypothetical protein
VLIERHAIYLHQYTQERLIVSIVVGIDDEDSALGDGELRAQAACEERGPEAQNGSMSIDLMISTLENKVRILGVVVDGRIAC